MKQIKILGLIFFVVYTGSTIHAQSSTIPVWQSEIPGEIKNSDYKENQVYKEGAIEQVSRVSTPTLTVFLADESNSNRTAVIVIPGGGYTHLSMNKEGAVVAKWLNSIGITAFVLKYRLPNDEIMIDKTIGPLQDAQEAIRSIRRNAKKFNINPKMVGIIGFSAGGHLAATLSTQYDNITYPLIDTISARPDFAMLIYPVISMNDKITHKGSKNNLLGDFPSNFMITKFSNENCVTANTPPTFIIHAADDKAVLFDNSFEYFLALKKHKVPAELHIYQKGGHGFGLNPKTVYLNWTKCSENWLINNQFIP